MGIPETRAAGDRTERCLSVVSLIEILATDNKRPVL